MKVYQLTKEYHDGDHDYGHYQSGIFATQELAQKCKDTIVRLRVKSRLHDPSPDNKYLGPWDSEFDDVRYSLEQWYNGDDISVDALEIHTELDPEDIYRWLEPVVTYS